MMKRPQDQYTQVQGHAVRYWTQGDTGPTVLLLHGISCSVLEWEHTIAALATQHRVIALDLLGCGLSDKPLDAGYDMLSQAKFVFAFMDAMGLNAVSMVGNSMGGCIALVRYVRRELRKGRGLCRGCGYEVQRLQVCPECGEENPHAVV
jgi:pimeloyl-ACP methyl ester carboxylesterase